MLNSFPFTQSTKLAGACKAVAEASLTELKTNGCPNANLAISVAVKSGDRYEIGDFNGNIKMYPASVAKLFHLVYLLHLGEEGRLALTPELLRGVEDMIRDSNNDATALVVDTFSGVCGGPELPESEFDQWCHQREEINRWYESLGFTGLNVSQKTWNEGPYGRERQIRGVNGEIRNRLSANDSLQLLTLVLNSNLLNERNASLAKDLLMRRLPADRHREQGQVTDYIGEAVPDNYQLWSKAGWTDEVRHDVAWLKSPNGQEFGLAIFSEGTEGANRVIPNAASKIITRIGLE